LLRGGGGLAPDDLDFKETSTQELPLYSPDFDSDFPPEATALKEAIARARTPSTTCPPR